MTYQTLPAEKIYFSQYTYKVSIELDSKPHIQRKMTFRRPSWSSLANVYSSSAGREDVYEEATYYINDGYTKPTKTIINKLKKITGGKCRTRITTQFDHHNDNKEFYQMDIYFGTEAHLTGIIKSFEKNILEIRKPVSQTHMDALTNEKTVVRKQLFWNKYKYKVIMCWREWYKLSDEETLDIANFCETTEGACRYNLETYSRTIYFENEDDLILLKLSYSELIDHLLIVKTMDELN